MEVRGQSLRGVQFQVICSLNEKWSYSLMYLNAWLIAGRTIWERTGGVLWG